MKMSQLAGRKTPLHMYDLPIVIRILPSPCNPRSVDEGVLSLCISFYYLASNRILSSIDERGSKGK